MESAVFIAVVLANELNLNKIAVHFGMNKKLRWEDPLVLQEHNLQGILRESHNKYVFIFYFGTVVFINFSHHEMMDVVVYLQKIEKNINQISPFTFQDDFKLLIRPHDEPSINYEDMVTPTFKDYYLEIVSTVLAKSVALEKIEHDIDVLFDDIEDIVDYLAKGRFQISDNRLAKTSATILRFKYNTIAYIMLLDKPDITWINEEAGNLFDKLSGLFELEERYETLRHKTETLMDITEVFTGLTHAQRGTRLEWMIIGLIALEIVLSLLDKFL